MMKISIVTVVFNAENSIEKTLLSVKGQTYKNIEYIIIDGGSEDATMSIVNAYADTISLIISERDSGIYDAMNKGATLSKGSYVTFLNAGDTYNSTTVIDDVFFGVNTAEHDVIYGSNYYRVNNKLVLQMPRALDTFYKGMPFNHQSAFVKTDLVKSNPFKNKLYRIQCEYDFLLSLYIKGHSFYFTDSIVAIYEAGGYSDQNLLERTLERWIIVKRVGICDSKVDAHYFGLVSQSMSSNGSNINRCGWASMLKKLLTGN